MLVRNSVLSILVALFFFAGCTTVSGPTDPAACMKKLAGTWEGDVAVGGMWAAGTHHRLVITNPETPSFFGYFGSTKPGWGLAYVPIRVLSIESGCRVTIDFSVGGAAAASTVRLTLMGDDALTGMFYAAGTSPGTITMWRTK